MKGHVYPKGCYFTSLAEIKGKNITVMGIGLNGGGEESVRFFLKHGAHVTATDIKEKNQLSSVIEKLEREFENEIQSGKLRFVLGQHKIEDFTNADVVIKNPAVKYWENKYLAAAKVIEIDVSVFLALNTRPVIAVTGSKGKSTTAAAVHEGLLAAGVRAFVGGNIGKNPLTFFDLPDAASIEMIVLELSSWQLADLRGRGILKPKIAIITPIFHDHMNWYKNDMNAYIADKKIIFSEQDAGDITICSFGNETGMEWGNTFAAETKAKVFRYGFSELPKNMQGVWIEENRTGGGIRGKMRVDNLTSPEGDPVLDQTILPSKTAKQNMLNAFLALSLLGMSPAQCADFFSKWEGLEDRMEYFHEWHSRNNIQVKFYNDTTATVPEATASAVESFGKPVRLICGGTDKELDFSSLIKTLCDLYKHGKGPASIYLLNGSATTNKLMPLLKKHSIAFQGPFDSLGILLEKLQAELCAMPRADEQTEELVIFSPGATSFGMFDNEFDRGRQFKETVRGFFRCSPGR